MHRKFARRARERALLGRSAALASTGVALFLLGLKFYAVVETGSTAMLGSLADTGLDLIASMVTLAGVWVASLPDDREHRFGHGKAEAIAAMVQVVLISVSAVGIAARAIETWIAGARTESAETGITVSVVAMLATMALLAWQRFVIRRTHNVAIATDHVHYQSDILLNLAVIAALALDQIVGVAGADSVFALGIAAWLGWNAFKASHHAINHLMDREWPLEKREKLLEMMRGHPQLQGVHDLRTRTAGNRDFAQFHVWVDGGMTVSDAHRVMDEIEDILAVEFPETEFLIHPDPAGLVDEGPIGSIDLLQEGAAPDPESHSAPG